MLLSGGLDSATTAAYAKDKGYELYALTVSYGQRHAVELDCARAIADFLRVVEHKQVELPNLFSGSALTQLDINVPKSDHVPADRKDNPDAIPVTYVPARNTIFLSLALAYAESVSAFEIFIGVNAVDYSGYPDCRPEFISAFQDMARLGTRAGVMGEKITIRTPILKLSKDEIIQMGNELGLDYSITSSCYDPLPSGEPCQRCEACHFRAEGFKKCGIPDPRLAQFR